MSLQEAKQFVAHFVTGDYTPAAYATFLQWLRGATVDEMNAIAEEHEALHESWPMAAGGPSSLWVAELEKRLDVAVERDEESEDLGENLESEDLESEDLESEDLPVRRIGRFSIRRVWVAAASVIVVFSAGGFWYARQHGRNQERSNISSHQESNINSRLSKIIINPRGGGQQQLILADGSKVWLNAASTLKYPEAFSGPERVVELSGEGFFEVAKNSTMPFRVRIKDAEVEVLGTQFNIMAYENDKVSRTTLIDGAVRLIDRSVESIDRSGSSEGHAEQKLLQPGQQAVMAYPSKGDHHKENGVNGGKNEGRIDIVTIANPNSVIAWKDGILQFDGADLATVMHTVERYYDVDIQFDQSMSGKSFTGSFPRGDQLDRVLKVLDNFYKFKSNIDGKIVTVIR
jgi:ferric-dicitrate binding protein FerR (iron transport regulator)